MGRLAKQLSAALDKLECLLHHPLQIRQLDRCENQQDLGATLRHTQGIPTEAGKVSTLCPFIF